MVTDELVQKLSPLGVRITPGHFATHDDAMLEGPCILFAGFDFRMPFRMGAFSYSYSYISPYLWEIGRYCSIAANCRFGDMEHPVDWVSTSNFTYDSDFWAWWVNRDAFTPSQLPPEPRRLGISLGHDVWIGANAYIRAGVNVGTGAIIGNSAVVTKDVPPYAVVVGNPGRVVKYRFSDALIEKLLASSWWKYCFTDFQGMNITNVEAFLTELDNGKPEPFAPPWTRLGDVIASLASPAAAPEQEPEPEQVADAGVDLSVETTPRLAPDPAARS